MCARLKEAYICSLLSRAGVAAPKQFICGRSFIRGLTTTCGLEGDEIHSQDCSLPAWVGAGRAADFSAGIAFRAALKQTAPQMPLLDRAKSIGIFSGGYEADRMRCLALHMEAAIQRGCVQEQNSMPCRMNLIWSSSAAIFWGVVLLQVAVLWVPSLI